MSKPRHPARDYYAMKAVAFLLLLFAGVAQSQGPQPLDGARWLEKVYNATQKLSRAALG